MSLNNEDDFLNIVCEEGNFKCGKEKLCKNSGCDEQDLDQEDKDYLMSLHLNHHRFSPDDISVSKE